MGDKASQTQGGGTVSTFVPGVADMTKNMMDSDLTCPWTEKQGRYVSRPRQCSFQHGQHSQRTAQSVSSQTKCEHVVHENERFSPFEGFRKTSELGGAVAARRSSQERRVPKVTHDWTAQNSNKIVGRNGWSSQTTSSQPSAWRLKHHQ